LTAKILIFVIIETIIIRIKNELYVIGQLLINKGIINLLK